MKDPMKITLTVDPYDVDKVLCLSRHTVENLTAAEQAAWSRLRVAVDEAVLQV